MSFKKKAYKEWLGSVCHDLEEAMRTLICLPEGADITWDETLCARKEVPGAWRWPGPVYVTIDVLGGRGFPTSRDIDNTCKAILDSLEDARVIANDNVQFVHRVQATYFTPEYHLELLGDKRPSRKSDLECAVWVTVENVTPEP